MNIRGLNVLMLCKDKDAVGVMETHLVYKGVNIRVTESVEKALSLIDGDPPNYVIVSVNHEDPMARKLLGILQGTQVHCIPAGENNHPDTLQALDDINIEHSLYPPLNGPRTESLLKYLENLKFAKQQSNAVDYTKGKSEEDDGSDLDYGKQEEGFKDALSELSREIKKSGAVSGGSPTTEEERMALLERAIAFENGEDYPEPNSEPSQIESSDARVDEPMGSMDIWHIFDEAMHGLDSKVIPESGENLSQTTEFLALSLESEHYPGYIFAVIDSSQASVRESMYAKIEAQLVGIVEQFTQEEISLQKVKLELMPFDFKLWIKGLSGTVQSFELEDSVVSWAYVDRPFESPSVSESPHSDYCSIELHDIQPGTSLPHDLYLYLPTNNKFLVYTREGFGIDYKQHGRLNDKSVNKMHVKKNDVDKFKNYKLESDVTNMVDEVMNADKKAA